MKKESIYISIPISGLDEAVQRAKAAQISTMLYEMGYDTVVNPFEVYDAWKATYNRDPTYSEIMEADLDALKSCDAIFMCLGWVESQGCRIERIQAFNNGQDIIYEL